LIFDFFPVRSFFLHPYPIFLLHHLLKFYTIFAIGATCDKAATKLNKTEGGGRAVATDGGGGH